METGRPASSDVTSWKTCGGKRNPQPLQANADAADILGAGEALAYGVGSAVAVTDVRRMKLATVLAGGHRGAAVTAVAWCANCSSGFAPHQAGHW